VSYQIATQTPQYRVQSLQDLSNIPITGAVTNLANPSPSMGSIAGNAPPSILASLASFSRATDMAVVSHYNVTPVIDIFGSVQGRDLGGVSKDLFSIINSSQKELPRGSQIIVRGQIQTMRSSFVGLLTGLIFAIVLVYLLIVLNFQSWLDPFIILMALPAALAGIVWFLFMTGTTISVPALTGSIMCVGVATANSILVVSFAKEQLQAGLSAVEAALHAGYMRFRPVLMTALAMIIGMAPMALGLGEGGEQNAPLGRAVIVHAVLRPRGVQRDSRFAPAPRLDRNQIIEILPKEIESYANAIANRKHHRSARASVERNESAAPAETRLDRRRRNSPGFCRDLCLRYFLAALSGCRSAG
jgi:multidrug efflux pump subunit AcrB